MSVEVDLRPLGWARAAFGGVLLLRTTPLLALLDPPFLRGLGPLLGWPDGAWHAPVLGLALPDAVVAALCVIRTGAALALALGIFARPAGVAAGVAGYLVLTQDAFGYFHHLHMLYLGAILLGLSDAGCTFAVRPDPKRSAASSVWLLRGWAASIYAWAAIGKLRADWIDGRALEEFRRVGALRGPIAETLVATPGARVAIAWIVLLAEALLGPALLWPRSRRVALVCAYLLHAAFEASGRVDTIGWQMGALLLVFFRARSSPPPPATR